MFDSPLWRLMNHEIREQLGQAMWVDSRDDDDVELRTTSDLMNEAASWLTKASDRPATIPKPIRDALIRVGLQALRDDREFMYGVLGAYEQGSYQGYIERVTEARYLGYLDKLTEAQTKPWTDEK